MDEIEPALRAAQAAVEQLSPPLQRQLAEWMLERVATRSDRSVVWLRHLPADQQSRLSDLLEKNREGELTRSERSELRRLGGKVDRFMVANAQELARAARPDLFDAAGRPIMRRVREAARSPAISTARRRKRRS